MKKRIIILSVVMLFGVTALGFAAEKTYPQRFYDVPKEHWAFEQIAELVNRGAINGYEDGSYKPDDTVTRAEWAKIMIKAANKPLGDNTPSFTDMTDHWANSFVNASKQYMTSYAGGAEFRPDIAALREDVTVALVKLKGYSVEQADFSYIAKFHDQDSISASCKKYVAVAIEKGLISGFPDDTFRGQDTLTRAEAATLLWRAFQKGNDDKVVDGGAQVAEQPSQSTGSQQTPAPPKTSEPTPVPTPKPSDEPQPSNQPTEEPEPPASKKYSVETVARASEVRSMIINAKGDIYYLSGNQVKKIENGRETTVALNLSTEIIESELAQLSGVKPDDFYTATITALESDRPIRFQDPKLQLLSYDAANDTIYLLAFSGTNSQTAYQTYSLVGVWDISDPEQPVTTQYINHKGYESPTERYTPYNDFCSVIDRGNLIFRGYSYGGYPPFCSLNLTTGIINEYADGIACDAFGILGGNLSALKCANDTIEQYQPGQKTFKHIYLDGSVSLRGIQSATAHNNAFYCMKDSNLYQIDAQGGIRCIVDNAELDFTDGMPIETVGEMVFDPDGNPVFYDTRNQVIRRIKL